MSVENVIASPDESVTCPKDNNNPAVVSAFTAPPLGELYPKYVHCTGDGKRLNCVFADVSSIRIIHNLRDPEMRGMRLRSLSNFS